MAEFLPSTAQDDRTECGESSGTTRLRSDPPSRPGRDPDRARSAGRWCSLRLRTKSGANWRPERTPAMAGSRKLSNTSLARIPGFKWTSSGLFRANMARAMRTALSGTFSWASACAVASILPRSSTVAWHLLQGASRCRCMVREVQGPAPRAGLAAIAPDRSDSSTAFFIRPELDGS